MAAPASAPVPLTALPGERLLLVAPHPDDEVLAAGGLLQQARRQGMDICIWQLSDGQTNPWPQRWMERRLRIRAVDTLRWGARRCAEARAGMAHLGIPEDALACLHWLDQGLTARIRTRLHASVAELAARLDTVQPDLVVLPALGDRHPDHSAAHVLTRLALQHTGLAPACLEYMVHGRARYGPGSMFVPLDAAMQAGKRVAMLEHRTQLALARGRLLRRVAGTEWFLPSAASPQPGPVAWLPWALPRPLLARLRLTLACATGAWVWRGSEAPLRMLRGRLALDLPRPAQACRPVYLRLEYPWRSAWIFDHWGWAALTPAL